MFWGSFSYDKKGPCHIWLPETNPSKKIAEKELAIVNREREAKFKLDWELESAKEHMQLRTCPGRKPQWRFTAKTGKLVRNGTGGIDWYWYQKVSQFL
jgi:hypothetical protein